MSAESQSAQRSGISGSPVILGTLILVAAVANINLAVANVALPEIGRDLDASQTGLNLVAVAYSLGLAASVLYFGALGDRYGRKMLLLVGTAVAIPASLLAAVSTSVELLFAARLIGGLAAGMAYPTTLSLITVLWEGSQRTKAIALWSSIGGAASALGPLVAGALLEWFAWGSVFLFTVPLAALALALVIKLVPNHVDESTERVDHISGVISIVMVGALIMGLNFAPVPGRGALALGLIVFGCVAILSFGLRQRRLAAPLYDVVVASRRIFWVAATAGVIVFGSLMASIYIGQQFLQNVLGYSSLAAGAAILPAAVAMVIVAPRAATLVESRGSRFTLLIGYGFCLAGFLMMLLLWGEGIPYWQVGLSCALLGAGVGFAGTPASHSLTGSVPSHKAGMASSTADLQRDFGGAIMQSLLGALLTAGYASAFSAAIAASPESDSVSDSVQAQLTKSFGSAADTAKQYPAYADQIIEAAKQSFLQGQRWAYTAGCIAVVGGIVLVASMFPRLEDERRMLAEYAAEDESGESQQR